MNGRRVNVVLRQSEGTESNGVLPISKIFFLHRGALKKNMVDSLWSQFMRFITQNSHVRSFAVVNGNIMLAIINTG